MRAFKITLLPLASALVLIGALLATKDYSTVNSDFFSLGYTATWGSRSFDETIWQAVTEMAELEENLPEEVDNFRVAVLPSDTDYDVVYLDFDRASLAGLKAGEIAPEMFIRDYVQIN